MALAGTALAVAGSRLVPQETAIEERPIYDQPSEAVEEVAEELRGGVEGITRRRLLAGTAGAAGVGLTAAVGSTVDRARPRADKSAEPHALARRAAYSSTSKAARFAPPTWSRGSFLTAFPQGADKEQLTSSLVVVRVNPDELQLPPARAGWAPDGILAYSKICTHAGCAVSLFRSPLSPSTESGGPALVCPCHYSTFDVLDGGSVEFGPAGRALPQLPLRDRRRRSAARRRDHERAGRPVLVGRCPMTAHDRRQDPLANPVRFVDRRLAPPAVSAFCWITSSPTTGASCSAR